MPWRVVSFFRIGKTEASSPGDRRGRRASGSNCEVMVGGLPCGPQHGGDRVGGDGSLRPETREDLPLGAVVQLQGIGQGPVLPGRQQGVRGCAGEAEDFSCLIDGKKMQPPACGGAIHRLQEVARQERHAGNGRRHAPLPFQQESQPEPLALDPGDIRDFRIPMGTDPEVNQAGNREQQEERKSHPENRPRPARKPGPPRDVRRPAPVPDDPLSALFPFPIPHRSHDPAGEIRIRLRRAFPAREEGLHHAFESRNRPYPLRRRFRRSYALQESPQQGLEMLPGPMDPVPDDMGVVFMMTAVSS